MSEVEKLRILLPHWIEHNGEHAREFREWSDRAGAAEEDILAAAELVERANARLEDALEKLGGAPEHGAHAGHHEHA